MTAATSTNPRLAAVRLVQGVIQRGESLSRLLAVGLPRDDPRQRALTQELAFGTLRWYHRLDAALGQLMSKPLKDKDTDLRALLLVGLYQLWVLDMPAHAAVSETVDAVGGLKKDWARGLVNGVLRNAGRRQVALLAQLDTRPSARWSHPDWWIERLQRDWPTHWQAILTANNQRPPMTLRVNARLGDRAAYLARLHAEDIEARVVGSVAGAIEIVKPVGVDALPGFRDGAVSVQDAAAQLAAPLLELHDGLRVLDACAAPGGKTGHILECAPQLTDVVAVDSEPHRLQRVVENLQRLKLQAQCVAADAAEPQTWWDGQPFDRILLDAPCSASGVVRRHPDIKVLRRGGDLEALVAQQQRLLCALWPLLASGGILLYVTCSVFQTENSGTVGAFLEQHSDATELPLTATWGQPQSVGRQVMPGEQNMDGFYFARMIKT